MIQAIPEGADGPESDYRIADEMTREWRRALLG
jgi:hypothetical protein